MAGNATLQKEQEVDWARQLRSTQNDFRMKQAASSGLSSIPQPEPDLVPPEQQGLQALPMNLPGDAANEDEDMGDEETSDADEEDEMDESADEDFDEATMQRQLAQQQRQEMLAQSAANIDIEEESETDENQEQAGAANQALDQALDQAGESSATVKLFARLKPGDDRNKKITGKIGFLIRVILLCVGGLEFITPVDKGLAAAVGSGGTQAQKNKDGEKKTDTLLTIALGLCILIQILQIALPIIIIFAVVSAIAK